MKRKDFFNKLGLGVAAAVVTPSVFIKSDNTEFIKKDNTEFINSESLKKDVAKPKRVYSPDWCCCTTEDNGEIFYNR